MAEKRIREGIAIDVVILSGAKINIKLEEQRRKTLMGIGLDKATLKYLFFADVGDGWFADTEKPDYTQGKGLSSVKFQHSLSVLGPITHSTTIDRIPPLDIRIASSRSSL